LMKAFQNVLDRVEKEKNKAVHTIVQPPYTIEGEKMLLKDLVRIKSRIAFEQVFEGVENRLHAIFIFLSMLELIQEQHLQITVGEGYNNFWVEDKKLEGSL
jgi:segregation and condensation protein A